MLDSLLDFHLRIIRRIRERYKESEVIFTISDIIFEEVFSFFLNIILFSLPKENIKLLQRMPTQIFVWRERNRIKFIIFTWNEIQILRNFSTYFLK